MQTTTSAPSVDSPLSPVAARTPKGRATRQRIVVAAAELIHTHGVACTSLDDVGAKAAVGKSQMYHYFTDKSELVCAVIDYQTERVLQVGDFSTWQGWQAWRDGVVAHYAERDCAGGCPLGSLVNGLAARNNTMLRAVSAGFDRWEGAFRQGLEHMQKKGRLGPAAEPAELASTLLIALQGGLLLGNVHRDVGYLELALDTAIATLRSYTPSAT
ncbi:MAG: TetR/AcrR family transcriptional regulator [Chloroflexota bacterium]|nr:TetR/AcrR family transcriptional regulator [Chloroflexota bacterium]